MFTQIFLTSALVVGLLSAFIMVLVVLPTQFDEVKINDSLHKLRVQIFILLCFLTITMLLPTYIQYCRIMMCQQQEEIIAFLSLVRSFNGLCAAIVLLMIYKVKYEEQGGGSNG